MMVETEQMFMGGMVFQVAAGLKMVLAVLVITITGGVLRSTTQSMLGFAIYQLTVTLREELPTIRTTVFLFVASGINLFIHRVLILFGFIISLALGILFIHRV